MRQRVSFRLGFAGLAPTLLLIAGCGGNDQSDDEPRRQGRQRHRDALVGHARRLGRRLRRRARARLRRAPPATRRSRHAATSSRGAASAPGFPSSAGSWCRRSSSPACSRSLWGRSRRPPRPRPGATTLTIQVTGRQWFWDVTYPSAHVRTANEIHIPVGEPVRVEVSSGDVIHSFWVPELEPEDRHDPRPDEHGHARGRPPRRRSAGQCAEFCGLQHAHMAFVVVAEPRAAVRRAGSRASRAGRRPPPTRALERGQQVFLGSGCVYCHTIAGTNASGKVGPDLTHLASRGFIGAGVDARTRPGYLAGWILDPQHVKPGNRMPGTDLTGPELQDLLDYLESLAMTTVDARTAASARGRSRPASSPGSRRSTTSGSACATSSPRRSSSSPAASRRR